MYTKLSFPSAGTRTQGALPEFMQTVSSSAGAARSASRS